MLVGPEYLAVEVSPFSSADYTPTTAIRTKSPAGQWAMIQFEVLGC
jgi:hypothetical protein